MNASLNLFLSSEFELNPEPVAGSPDSVIYPK